ncbi:NCS2 family permease [Campylobacter jejuni]|uniref:NCS2 family permease n=1 Tax=Campylobacter TaxID=194 RepID=UPI00015D033F|nr:MULTISPECIES: NCS2 family permease [Campylobacter]ABV52886.1 putative transmembrane transport protein [Campylobacter jejuni subsp. jejuni 81116]EAB5306688.1 NCS2 family permease [Campylobacter jejuni]EAH4501314.1 NCS2 family permease [Campylobacter jejuni]EAH4984897.1 NCS2 family permease [Campylobacter jejuni]EAH5238177.1 NCS2 family permease [Campylobacter jejuni]
MDFFKLKENNTSFKTEVIAGLTTFLAMVYIIPVNSSIVGNTGMPIEALITATALITIVASAFNAFFANTPVAMSVGMGLNAYFTFAVCLGQKIPWQSALGAVFISSIIFLLLSFTHFRLWVIRNIPKDLRLAICAGIGCFIAFLGLSQMGVIMHNKDTLVSIGNFKSPHMLFGIFTLALIIFFWAIKLRGAFIFGVLASSIIAWIFHLDNASFPVQIFSLPNFSMENGLGAIFLQLDIKSALNITMIPIILTFFITQLFDSIGTITGVGERGKIFDDPKNGEKKLSKTLMADATGSALGAMTGTSTVTAFVESTTGVESGGRTGLTALVVAICFAFTLFLLPLFKAIPANAIYPVLVMVGILMFMEVKNIDFKDSAIAVASFFTIIMMPFTYSITTGFAFGFLSYLLVRIFKREWDKINLGIIVLSLLSLGNFLLMALQ